MNFFKKRLLITYTKENLYTGEVYSGRASGLVTDGDLNEGDARSILAKRDSSHHKNEDGFDRVQIDLYSQNSDAIRGREEELIEHCGREWEMKIFKIHVENDRLLKNFSIDLGGD